MPKYGGPRHHQKLRNRSKKRVEFSNNRGARSIRNHLSFAQRRSMRQAELGRMTEDRVGHILAKKLETGELVSYEHHAPNTREDAEGKDFTVTLPIGQEKVCVSFDVSISVSSHQDHIMKHPSVPSILIPPEMRDERIWERIVMLAKGRLEP